MTIILNLDIFYMKKNHCSYLFVIKTSFLIYNMLQPLDVWMSDNEIERYANNQIYQQENVEC